MNFLRGFFFSVLAIVLTGSFSFAEESVSVEAVDIKLIKQHEKVTLGSESALAVKFNPKENWHFYASEENAPGGMNLKVKPEANEDITFGEPLFPESHLYEDKTLGKEIEVYSGEFKVFIPFQVSDSAKEGNVEFKVNVEGAICSDMQCRMPDFGTLNTALKIDPAADMSNPAFQMPEKAAAKEADKEKTAEAAVNIPDYSLYFALVLALVAGLVLNIMPCVWPVLPVIVMRIVDQAKHSKGRSFMMGLAFSGGILLFFAGLALLNIVLQLFYGTVLQWGDQFRNPVIVAVMSLILIVLALFMFGIFNFSLPSSVTGKAGQGKGFAGSVGMGFLAAILSTPCSFGILAAAFAWAQAQPLFPATVVIMTIGIGMAIPYIILTSMPGLLKKLPRGGKWMEIFKEAVGFLLLLIAIKLMTALPEGILASVMYYSVVLSFCVWMWGKWVGFGTPAGKKWTIRGLAVLLAVWSGFTLFSPPASEDIDWIKYDESRIQEAIESGRPVLIKFTADWCMSCKVVDVRVYGREDVQELIENENVLAIKADTTERDLPATKALKEKYNEPGVPVSILLVPGKEEPIRWRNIDFADDLKKELKAMPEKLI